MAAVALTALLMGVARSPCAAQLSACVAGDVSSGDPVNCPASTSAPCTIAQTYTVANFCELDFGNRDVTITKTGALVIGSGSVIVDARSLTLSGGLISGRITAAGGSGGSITINTTGAFTCQKNGAAKGTIDVSASSDGGSLTINAGGTVTVAGALLAQGLNSDATGGSISITAGGDIVGSSTGQISAQGDQATIDLCATGGINLPMTVNANGASTSSSDGGTLNATAGGDITFGADLQANAVSSDGGDGGTITIEAGGNVQLQGHTYANGIDGGCGGTVCVTADSGNLTVGDDVQAEGTSGGGAGGTIELNANVGSVVTQPTATTTAATSDLNSVGGMVTITAGLDISTGGPADVSGGCGGTMELCAERAITVQASLSANAIQTTGGGIGGSICVSAGTQVQLLGPISANGSSGGNGGMIDVTAPFGDLTIAQGIQARGTSPGGTGGNITLSAQGSIVEQAGATLNARSDASDGCGGAVDAEATVDLSIANQIDASGGAGGGSITTTAGGNLTVAGNLLATGRSPGSNGGSVTAEAGMNQTGNRGTLLVYSTVDASGGSCGTAGCGSGGSTDLEGCNVSIGSAGIIRAKGGGSGGSNLLLAHEQLGVFGTVDATASAATGTAGSNTFEYPSRTAPIVTATLVTPASVNMPMSTCTATGQTGCLVPCPTCGDGIIEFPETCDTSVGRPVGCDGCSAFCQIQSCQNKGCPALTCDPLRGCNLQVVPPQLCGLPIFTPTRSATVIPTATASPNRSTSPRPTPTPTPTASPLPTTVVAHPPGDANCDGQVTAADLPALLTLLADDSAIVCGADANGDGLLNQNDVAALIALIYDDAASIMSR